jgi:hypothetical protein
MTILFFSSSSSFDFFLRLFLFLFFFSVYLAYVPPMIYGLLELGILVCNLSVSLGLDMYRTWGLEPGIWWLLLLFPTIVVAVGLEIVGAKLGSGCMLIEEPS